MSGETITTSIINLDLIIPAFASLAAPFFAIYANRKIDEAKFKSNEKLNVFKTLMTSRANQQSNISFVEAINIIDVIFSDSSDIICAKNNFISHRCCDIDGKSELDKAHWDAEDKKILII